MTTRYILEDVELVQSDFAADTRDKAGLRVVRYNAQRSIKLHLAIAHIVQIEEVNDAKAEPRSIVTLSSGQRYVTRRGAQDLCSAIEQD